MRNFYSQNENEVDVCYHNVCVKAKGEQANLLMGFVCLTLALVGVAALIKALS